MQQSNVKTCSCSTSPNVADKVECHACDARCNRCGSKDLAGGVVQYCECVREYFKCALDVQCTAPSEMLCDANDLLGGAYAQHCPELCAAFMKVTKATTKEESHATNSVSAADVPERNAMLLLILLSFSVAQQKMSCFF